MSVDGHDDSHHCCKHRGDLPLAPVFHDREVLAVGKLPVAFSLKA